MDSSAVETTEDKDEEESESVILNCAHRIDVLAELQMTG